MKLGKNGSVSFSIRVVARGQRHWLNPELGTDQLFGILWWAAVFSLYVWRGYFVCREEGI
jgi:hypothetical protein